MPQQYISSFIKRKTKSNTSIIISLVPAKNVGKERRVKYCYSAFQDIGGESWFILNHFCNYKYSVLSEYMLYSKCFIHFNQFRAPYRSVFTTTENSYHLITQFQRKNFSFFKMWIFLLNKDHHLVEYSKFSWIILSLSLTL